MDSNRARTNWIVPVLLITLGVTLRAVRFGADRSLWQDEAALALNITGSTITGLTEPLSHAQIAPVGFLIAVKLAAQTVNYTESGLRVIPFTAAALSIPMFWIWCRGFMERGSALLALAFFAFCEPLIYYGSELKQYSTDMLTGLVILWAAMRLLQNTTSKGHALVLLLCGTVGIWISHPAVFVCAGCIAALFAHARRNPSHRYLSVVGIICAFWVLNFIVEYFIMLRHTPADQYLTTFWQSSFLPFPPRTVEDWLWFPRTFLGIFSDPVGLNPAVIGASLFVLGVISWRRQKLSLLMFLLMPIMMTALASSFRLFPFATNMQNPVLEQYPALFHPQLGRVILFIAPLLIVIVSVGGCELISDKDRAIRSIGIVLLSIVMYTSVMQASRNVWNPPDIHDVRSLIADLTYRHGAKDIVLAQTFSREVVSYYLQRSGWHPSLVDCSFQEFGDGVKLSRLFQKYAPSTRLWLVSVHHPRWASELEQQRIVALIMQHARQIDRIDRYRASAILFEIY